MKSRFSKIILASLALAWLIPNGTALAWEWPWSKARSLDQLRYMTFSLGSHSSDTNDFIRWMDGEMFNDGAAWQPTRACWNGITNQPSQGDITVNHSTIKRVFKSAEPYSDDQVDLIYFAGHGVHPKGNLQSEHATMLFYPRDIKSPYTSGSATDRLLGGYSCSAWGRGLKWAIFAACSVLDIVDDPPGDTKTPGYGWAKIMLGFPRPMHAILGFRWISPGEGPDSEMLDYFFQNLDENNIVASWINAGIRIHAYWVCAIYDSRFQDEYLPGCLLATDPPGYDTTLVDLTTDPNPILTFSYATRSWFWDREDIDFLPWYHDLNGSIMSYAQIACADLGLVSLPEAEDTSDSHPARLYASPNIADAKLELPSIMASPQTPNVRLEEGWTKRMDEENEVTVYTGNRLSLATIDESPERVIGDVMAFASRTFGLDKRKLNAVCLQAVMKTDMKGNDLPARTSVGMYSCRLLQDYKGIPVYSDDGDGVQVLVDGSGISSASARLSTFRLSGAKKPIISASTALASIQRDQKASDTFSHGDIDAKLVYYPLSQGIDRLLVPAWRIAHNDDSCVVDGYTGRVIESAVRPSN